MIRKGGQSVFFVCVSRGPVGNFGSRGYGKDPSKKASCQRGRTLRKRLEVTTGCQRWRWNGEQLTRDKVCPRAKRRRLWLRIPQDATAEKESSLGINQEDANIIPHLPSLWPVSSAPYISFQPPSLLTLEESQATWGWGKLIRNF